MKLFSLPFPTCWRIIKISSSIVSKKILFRRYFPNTNLSSRYLEIFSLSLRTCWWTNDARSGVRFEQKTLGVTGAGFWEPFFQPRDHENRHHLTSKCDFEELIPTRDYTIDLYLSSVEEGPFLKGMQSSNHHFPGKKCSFSFWVMICSSCRHTVGAEVAQGSSRLVCRERGRCGWRWRWGRDQRKWRRVKQPRWFPGACRPRVGQAVNSWHSTTWH